MADDLGFSDLGCLNDTSVTLAEVLKASGYHAAMTGKWHVTHFDYSANQWNLYDMENDRTKTRNLANQHSDQVAQMAAMWEAWAKRRNVKH